MDFRAVLQYVLCRNRHVSHRFFRHGRDFTFGSLGFCSAENLLGKGVIGVSGGPGPYEPSGSTGKWVLYISTARPYLPVELVGREGFNGGTLSFTDTLSRYGARVVVKAPLTPFPSLRSVRRVLSSHGFGRINPFPNLESQVCWPSALAHGTNPAGGVLAMSGR